MGCIDQNLTYCPGSFIHPDTGERLMCPLRLKCARYTYEVSLFHPDRAELMLEDGVYDVESSSCLMFEKTQRHSMWSPSH